MTLEGMPAHTKRNGLYEDVNSPETANGLLSHTTITHCDIPSQTSSPRSSYNTYQLEPDIKFPRAIVANIVKEVVDDVLLGGKYEPGFCRQASRLLTDVLKSRVKSLRLKRYRIIAQAIISSAGDPNFNSSSLCLWDSALDTCVSYEFCNGSIVAVVSVFGIYQS